MSALTTRSIVFVGHVDQQNLVVVAKPNGGSDAVIYYGPEGSLSPQGFGSDSGSWAIPQGVLKKQRNGFVWTGSGARGLVPVYARDPKHFIVRGAPGEDIHVVSQMRHFVYADTNGVTHVAVTAIGTDMSSVEFYMNFAGRSDDMIRRPVSDVTVGYRDRRMFYVELPRTLFSYMEVGEYRRNLPRKAVLPPDLPKSGYVGVMDGCLRPIDASTLHVNQAEGRVRAT